MKKTRVIIAFITSTILSFIGSILSDLTASSLSKNLVENTWLIVGAWIATFVISLPITLYIFLHSLSNDNPAKPLSASLHSETPPKDKFHIELIGREANILEIISSLRDPINRWMVSIDGMGGIGKTALAQEIASKCLSEHLFEKIVWASSVNNEFDNGSQKIGTELTFDKVLDVIGLQLGDQSITKMKGENKEKRASSLLRAQRTLVVLDNLETASDHQDDITRRLLPILNPSKALLTSRHRFQGETYSIHLTGLEQEDSMRFIRQEAIRKGIHQIATAKSDELRIIAETTGGSPLALKLIVGQVTHLPLSVVLNQLRDIRPPTGINDDDNYVRLYKGIFLPSWRLLSSESKRLLIGMAHFPPEIGGSYEAIKVVSELTNDAITHCINELWNLSFLEIGSTQSIEQKRYYLHPLTQYFVLSDIVNKLK